jgi:enoyl-CoA hydratase
MHSEPEILFERLGTLGLVTLNRPKALNALTRDMCLKMSARLGEWAFDDQVRVVAVRGAGGRAFCAGGDIRTLYAAGKAGSTAPRDFYRDEYRLDSQIHHYEKPYVALLDGITMGGGVGISVHGRHRIVTERTVFAMPETAIGFFPDVGGSYFLPRCPGELGAYLGLTGERLKGGETVYAGVGTAYLPSQSLPGLLGDLAELRPAQDSNAEVAAAIGRHLTPHELPPIAAAQAAIDRHFAAASVEAILASLEADGDEPFARKTLETLAVKSPTSLKLSYRAAREGRALDLDRCLQMEFRLALRCMKGHDFYEGVRAVIIDKDNRPEWRPARLEDVSDADIAAYFTSLAQDELVLSTTSP